MASIDLKGNLQQKQESKSKKAEVTPTDIK